MNKAKAAATIRTRKANHRRRNGANGQRGNGESANGKRPRGAVRNWRNPKNGLDPAIQRYVDLYEFAPIAYVAFDRSGRIQDLNLAATNLLNRKREQLMGAPFSLCVFPADLDLFLRHLARCRADERRVETALRLRKHDGVQLSVVLSSTPTSNLVRDGAQLFQTAIVDLTEREETRARVTEQTRLLDLSNDAILVRDPGDRIVYWNRGATEIYGFTANEALGKISHELLRTEHSESREKILKEIHRADRWTGELIHTRKDGMKIMVMSRWALDRDARGRPASILETNTDITARKRVEKELELVSRLPQENPAPVIRLQEGRILSFANPAAKPLLASWATKLGDPAPTEFVRIARAALTCRRKEELEANLAKRCYAIEVCPIPEGNYVNLYFNDITARKRAETALERSRELLEQLVQKRTKALQTANAELESEIRRRKGLEGQILEISDREQERLGQELHDGLCQQLTAIGFLARATALRLKDHRVVQTEELEKIAQLINSSVMDARNIARDLHKEEIDAAEFETALEELVDRKIWKTPCRLDLKTKIEIENDTVASQLYRILREAIINANKHARATEIVLEAKRNKRDLVFQVSDDGVGFHSKNKGHGLGFHIMKYRAESIGARLELESLKKRGARVTCYLPIEMTK